MDRYEIQAMEAQTQLKSLNRFLNNLRKKSKEYLVGFIEGIIVSGQIKIKEDKG